MCDLDPVFRALANRRRRIAISCLQRHHLLSLADLTELVAEEELDRNVAAISGERIRDLYLSLYHTHLPPLIDAELVRYDQEEDLVARTERTTTLLTGVRDRVDALVE
ncbi:MAG: hypothetical protein ABEJ81_06715 [Haloferacaceae archaeon]